MTMRGFRLLQDHWLMRERGKYARSFQVINYITAAFGRQSELKPEDVFPILADAVARVEEENDIDPRDSMRQMTQMLSR